MPSTGTITLNPRSAAAPAVCNTEVCACVPIATTVLMPLSLRVFSRSLAMNLSDRARATRTALVGAGLLGEIHHQQRRLVRNDRCRLERGRCRKFGGGPFLDHGLCVRAG